MVLYMGEREIFDYLAAMSVPVIFSSTISQAEKIIITEYSDQAVRLIREAMLINVPVLGILDGFRSVVSAFGGRCEDIECAEGKQEWAVADTSVPIYKNLETTIRICRGKPVGVVETILPKELDCITRSDSGDILAVCNLIAPSKHGNIYGINYYIASDLTPDAEKIINNFLNI
ncbi:MAG: hypothetical protein PUB42_01245 [Firmicutes bacterium]|nr:hypothetical protein [Bacillota bacterium]